MQQQAPEDLAFRKPAAKVSFSAGKGASLPVFDPPLYDDDIFGGVPGVRRASVVAYEDVFSGGGFVACPSPAAFEELLGNFGAADPRTKAASSQRSSALNPRESLGGDLPSDELRLGFGAAEPVMPRSPQDLRPSQQTSSGLVDESSRKADDPSIVIEPDPDLLRATTFRRFSDLDPFSVASHAPDGTGKRPFFSKSIESVTRLDDIPLSMSPGSGPSKSSVNTVRDSHTSNEASSPTWSIGSMDSSEAKSMRRNYPSMKDQVKGPTIVKTEPLRSNGGYEAGAIGSPSRREQQLPLKDNVPPVNHVVDEPLQFSKVEKSRRVDQFWITIDDVKLATQPLAVPPPSRPPPAPISKPGFTTRNQGDAKLEHAHKTVPSFYESTGNQHEATSSWQQVRPGAHTSVKATSDDASSVLDEFEEFVSGVSRAWKDASSVQEEQQADGTAAAAAAVASATAMKEAMERAEAKFRLAKEAREREKEVREREIKAAKPRGEREKARESRERAAHEVHEREACEMHDREEREKVPREAREREERERGEKEGELMERWRREREKEKGREREREKDRIAVERAIREARERAVGRERAERVASEARERAERAAVERGSTQARERAAAETRERVLERDAVERAAAEARSRAERAAVDRAAAEARERAQRSAVERAAAAKEQQRRNENNSETFFTSGSRASSAPRQRPSAVDTSSDLRPAAKGFPSEGQKRSSTGVAGVRKVASTTNMADDWSSLFTAGEFQEVEGESAERRSSRWERHQRTLERTVKALEEKNQRDLQSQREQAERQRAAEILDVEIKRWATGKEGNLRALLATLHYILWPECGWQPVSLTDLITSAAVKKAYRKATLCVHPDKVQQKGATIQQKYAAEKVFDLLKEGWNKFNAEELF